MNSFSSESSATAAELLALADPARRWGCSILDLRPEALSATSHLPGSAALPVAPGAEFASALPAHMLPAAGASLVVVGATAARAREAAEHLVGRGYRARWFQGELEALPWESGPATGALWSPDPFLAAHHALLPEPEAGPIADLGAGNGRNAVFLAARGYRVHCYDRLPDALALARDRAARHRLAERVTTHQQLLKQGALPREAPFAAILMIRFHEKTLMGALREQLKPEGVVLVHTYAPAPRPEGRWGPRRARHQLAAREVERLFPSPGWTFLARSDAFQRTDEAMIGFVVRADGEGRRGP